VIKYSWTMNPFGFGNNTSANAGSINPFGAAGGSNFGTPMKGTHSHTQKKSSTNPFAAAGSSNSAGNSVGGFTGGFAGGLAPQVRAGKMPSATPFGSFPGNVPRNEAMANRNEKGAGFNFTRSQPNQDSNMFGNERAFTGKEAVHGRFGNGGRGRSTPFQRSAPPANANGAIHTPSDANGGRGSGSSGRTIVCFVCQNTFPSFPDLHEHMRKENHYKPSTSHPAEDGDVVNPAPDAVHSNSSLRGQATSSRGGGGRTGRGGRSGPPSYPHQRSYAAGDDNLKNRRTDINSNRAQWRGQDVQVNDISNRAAADFNDDRRDRGGQLLDSQGYSAKKWDRNHPQHQHVHSEEYVPTTATAQAAPSDVGFKAMFSKFANRGVNGPAHTLPVPPPPPPKLTNYNAVDNINNPEVSFNLEDDDDGADADSNDDEGYYDEDGNFIRYEDDGGDDEVYDADGDGDDFDDGDDGDDFDGNEDDGNNQNDNQRGNEEYYGSDQETVIDDQVDDNDDDDAGDERESKGGEEDSSHGLRGIRQATSKPARTSGTSAQSDGLLGIISRQRSQDSQDSKSGNRQIVMESRSHDSVNSLGSMNGGRHDSAKSATSDSNGLRYDARNTVLAAPALQGPALNFFAAEKPSVSTWTQPAVPLKTDLQKSGPAVFDEQLTYETYYAQVEGVVPFRSVDNQTHFPLTNLHKNVGICADMCPVEERENRDRCLDIHKLETVTVVNTQTLAPLDITNPVEQLKYSMIKKFQRSSADHDLLIPSLIRTPYVLLETVSYVESIVADIDKQVLPGAYPHPLIDLFHRQQQQQQKHTKSPARATMENPYYWNFVNSRSSEDENLALTVYLFIWDRYRMIAKDFILQSAVLPRDILWVETVERMARWHVYMDHRMRSLGKHFLAGHAQQNLESMNNLLKTLDGYYRNVALLQLPENKQLVRNQAEFAAYYLLVQLANTGVCSKFLQTLPVHVLKHAHIQLVLKVRRALKQYNYVEYFRLLTDEATPLQAGLMVTYAASVRGMSVRMLSRSTAKGAYYPIAKLEEILKFERAESSGKGVQEQLDEVQEFLGWWVRFHSRVCLSYLTALCR
jgi:hypothetical protein